MLANFFEEETGEEQNHSSEEEVYELALDFFDSEEEDADTRADPVDDFSSLWRPPTNCEDVGDDNKYEAGGNHMTKVVNVLRGVSPLLLSQETMGHKRRWIQSHMGNMAQCRGAAGDAWREAGAVDMLLQTLWDIQTFGWRLHDTSLSTADVAPPTGPIPAASSRIELAIVALGALRDLACGSALNREAIYDWSHFRHNNNNAPPIHISTQHMNRDGDSTDDVPPVPPGCGGIEILVIFMRRYHLQSWQSILSLPEWENTNTSPLDGSHDKMALRTTTTITHRGQRELRLLTNAVGVIRNISHSTPPACLKLDKYGATPLLIWRLLNGQDDNNDDDDNNNNNSTTEELHLPDASKPWRETSFRIACALINMAEKCEQVAITCASNAILIQLLIEAWGGDSSSSTTTSKKKQTPLLHLGLAAVLHAAKDTPEYHWDPDWQIILDKEMERKRVAQLREMERKARLLSSVTSSPQKQNK